MLKKEPNMFSYLHIPFCRQKCPYCKFALTPVFNGAKIELYLAHLKQEIRDFFETEHIKSDEAFRSIYFGGGTPSILSKKQIEDIVELFRSYLPFVPDIEITLEANPEDITPEYTHELLSVGISRVSLGIQTLNPLALKEISRSDPETIFRALDAIFAAGFVNVNVDFILGLPHVSPWGTLDDIKTLLDRYPLTHTSVYLLEDDIYPSHWKNISMDAVSMQSEQVAIREFLASRGLRNYEISNFAKPGFESRHNQAYWDHSNSRWFGLSAASYLDGKRFANSASFAGYYRKEFAYEETLTPEALRIERCMFGIRTSGIERADIRNQKKFTEYLASGLLMEQNGKILPTSAWIFLIDHIIGELI